jgi:hypothetical protein
LWSKTLYKSFTTLGHGKFKLEQIRMNQKPEKWTRVTLHTSLPNDRGIDFGFQVPALFFLDHVESYCWLETGASVSCGHILLLFK